MSSTPILQSIIKKLPVKVHEQLLDHQEYAAAETPAKIPTLMEFLEDRRNLAQKLVKAREDKNENPRDHPAKKPLHLSATGADNSSDYSCLVRGCTYRRKHPIWKCRKY